MKTCTARLTLGQALPRCEATWPIETVQMFFSACNTLSNGACALCVRTKSGAVHSQGPRESMEDCAYVIPRARCGFLFAGTPLHTF